MDKKQVVLIYSFLSLLFVLFAMTTISASDFNDSVDDKRISDDYSKDMVTQKSSNTFDDSLRENSDINKLNDSSKFNDNINTKSMEKINTKPVKKEWDSSYLFTDLELNVSDTVYVGDNISINGVLYCGYYTDTPYIYENISVEFESDIYNLTTDENGYFYLNVPASIAGRYTIIAKYSNDNPRIGNSIDYAYVEILKYDTSITVDTDKSIYVGDEFHIYGNLKTYKGNIPNATIRLTVDNSSYYITTLDDGSYNANITVSFSGNKTVEVYYPGSYNYTDITSITSVYAYDSTQLSVVSHKSGYVGEKVSVYGNLKKFGENLANARITLKVDGKTFSVITDEYGNYNAKILMSKMGNKTIISSYVDSKNNIYDTNKTIVNVKKKPTKLTLNTTSTVLVGNKVSIYGKLTSRDASVSDKTVTINFDGKKYNVTTNKNGFYSLKAEVKSSGKHKVRVNYAGSTVYTSTVKSKSFRAEKRKTSIRLSKPLNLFVGEKVNIKGKLISKGSLLSEELLIIDVDGKRYKSKTKKDASFGLKIGVKSSGKHKVRVSYNGSAVYTSAVNSTYFAAEKRLTHISLRSTKKLYLGDKLNINGRLTSKKGAIPKQKIKLTVEGKTYTITTKKYGEFNLKVTSKSTSYKRIYVKYDGNNKYKSSRNNTSYTSKPLNKITIGSTSTVYVGERVSVYGKLTTRDKSAAYKKVTVNLEGKNYKTTTNKYGKYNLKLIPLTSGTKRITVSYGNINKYGVSEYTYFDAYKKSSTISVQSSDSVQFGDKVNVYGKLTSNGNEIPYKTIKININGKHYSTTTNQHGYYNIAITTTSIGKNKILATFTGSDEYYGSDDYVYFTVTKPDSKITVSTTKNPCVGDDVNIYGKLSSKGRGLADQEVVINVESKYYYVFTDTNGKYNLKIDALKKGNNYISVYYDGDSNHKATSTNTKFKVIEPFGTLMLDVGTMYYGESTSKRYVGNNLFSCWYQTYDGQYDKGIHVETIGYNPRTDRYSSPEYTITDALFFFKDSDDEIHWSHANIDYNYYTYLGHTWVSGWTPYKVVVYYRKATAYERQNF
ncbi:Ig-like domain repeat protein [Methanosphaera sp. ISO3-F5]|uniref:Ig-like domain repeat protein n=1 Tax=Methanosphaera sp. ISO3-F5 TaxID=1452353 RepID=UPI002B25CB84|nr:Ig-like domain repeat protein [Methanosphaera sp. ISO3-F5]WQH63680.1 hypothetical protein PXD04_08230 [Methanosphaera sp. ISO3-F5]